MIRYATLPRTPKIFPALTGLTLGEFERLAAEFEAAHSRARAASTPHQEGLAAARAKLATPAAVIAAFPEVKIVIEGKEQPFRRPQGWDRQKPFSSGKKERHTVKNRIVCTPEGRIGGVSDTAPGSTHDLTLMRGDGILDRLDEGQSAMADKADTGGQKDRPGTPLVVPAKATRGHPLTAEQKGANRVISGYRVVIEPVMAQLNRFHVLKPVFRSAFERHTGVIRVVAALVDRRVATVPLKTDAVN